MTEEQWQACNEVHEMLWFLRGKVGDRKLYLFACACVRRGWGRLYEECSRQVVEWAERHADGAGHPEPRELLRREAAEAGDEVHRRRDELPNWGLEIAILDLVEEDDDIVALAARVSSACLGYVDLPDQERRVQPALLRCVCGSLFHATPLRPDWRRPAVVSLALAAYEERVMPSGHLDAARLAVLSDALEEAGCTDEATLSHLRSPGPHVRGCWPLDLILGNE